MRIKYAFKTEEENSAKAYGRSLGISTKLSAAICNKIRSLHVEKAKSMLEKVIEKKEPVKMEKHNRDTAHKKGIGPGKFPVNAAKEILLLLKSVESNALNKGLSSKDLVIGHISAHKADRPWRYGRKRRVRMKRTHVQIQLVEKKAPKKEQKKQEEKPQKKNQEEKK